MQREAVFATNGPLLILAQAVTTAWPTASRSSRWLGPRLQVDAPRWRRTDAKSPAPAIASGTDAPSWLDRMLPEGCRQAGTS